MTVFFFCRNGGINKNNLKLDAERITGCIFNTISLKYAGLLDKLGFIELEELEELEDD